MLIFQKVARFCEAGFSIWKQGVFPPSIFIAR